MKKPQYPSKHRLTADGPAGCFTCHDKAKMTAGTVHAPAAKDCLTWTSTHAVTTVEAKGVAPLRWPRNK